MLKFLVKRIATGVFTIWIISMLIFALYYLVPNNVARRMAGHNASPTTIKLITQRLGLDDPVWQQYLRFVGHALKGDLGTDYYFQLPVSQVIRETFPVTLSVIIGAAVIWLVVGVVSGVISAVHPRSLADRGVTVLALVFYSIPVFVLGLTLIYFLYFKLTVAGLPIFPPGGYKPLSAGVNQWFFHLILPWITLAMISAAIYTRLTRGSMLETLSEDYIKTARAKGISERRVNYRHALRSALTPVITQFGIDVGTLFGSAVITETVFSLPGMGRASLQAIRNQDLPLILGITLLAAVAVVVANIVVDILYAVLDPRVRLS